MLVFNHWVTSSILVSPMFSLKNYYESDSTRFWNPLNGMIGRDIHLAHEISSFGSNLSVLEYGPGSGSLLLNLYRQRIASRICGYDISSQIISSLRTNYESIKLSSEPASSSHFFVTNDDSMHSTPDSSFDVGVCADTLEHVLDPFIVLKEFHRILKPGGKLLISVPNYSYFKHLFKLIRGKQPITGGKAHLSDWIEHGWDGMHLHTFTHQSLTSALNVTGFKVMSVIGDSSRKTILSPIQRSFPTLLSGTLTAISYKL